MSIDKKELKREALDPLEKVVRFSLASQLNIHSSVGGKYGELWVAYELSKHKPVLGRNRTRLTDRAVDVKNPRSCDIVLAGTKKKLEVKWAMCHYRADDLPYTKGLDGMAFWGWGFSLGKQFIGRKFDYCILLAAAKDDAVPKHIFLLDIDEMTENSMGGKRPSAVTNQGSYYIEFSENPRFFTSRKWDPKGRPTILEKHLFMGLETHRSRWRKLKKDGKL